jgi:hypothetical protein
MGRHLSTVAASAGLVPSVARLRALFGTPDATQALFAGASVYLNFISLTRTLGHDDSGGGSSTGAPPVQREAAQREYLERAASRYARFVVQTTRGSIHVVAELARAAVHPRLIAAVHLVIAECRDLEV